MSGGFLIIPKGPIHCELCMISGWVPFVIIFFGFIPQGCTYGPICSFGMCVCVCVYTNGSFGMYVCVCVYTNGSFETCVCVCIAHLGVVLCVCIHIAHLSIYVCEYIHIHILTYIYPHTGFVVWTLKFSDQSNRQFFPLHCCLVLKLAKHFTDGMEGE
jgi:hypothetical protein